MPTYRNKVIRTAKGNFMTVKIPESSAADLAKARPEEIWQTGDKRTILIRDMDTQHIANAMRKMEGRHATTMKLIELPLEFKRLMRQMEPQWGVMLDELARRAKGEKPTERVNRLIELE